MNRANREARMQIKSRNQREGYYCGRFKHMDEDTRRHHRTSVQGLSLKLIYPPAAQVERLTKWVLARIKELDAKPK